MEYYLTDVTSFDLSEDDKKKLSHERILKANRCKDPLLKKCSLAVEHLLCEHLLKNGIDSFPLNIGYTKNGKPYLIDYPKIKFSFSHSDKYAACAVADFEIGIDIELKTRKVNDLLYKRIHASGETDDLLLAWCAKEAYLKYTGDGIAGRYSLCDIAVFDDRVENRITGEIVKLKTEIRQDALIALCFK